MRSDLKRACQIPDPKSSRTERRSQFAYTPAGRDVAPALHRLPLHLQHGDNRDDVLDHAVYVDVARRDDTVDGDKDAKRRLAASRAELQRYRRTILGLVCGLRRVGALVDAHDDEGERGPDGAKARSKIYVLIFGDMD